MRVSDHNRRTYSRLLDVDTNNDLAEQFSIWGVQKGTTPSGGNYFDFNRGGLLAGIHLGRIATADYGCFVPRRVRLGSQVLDYLDVTLPNVARAGLGLQYAGMPLKSDSGDFVLGSGAMRGVAQSEDVYQQLPEMKSKPGTVLAGTVEMDGVPDDSVVKGILEATKTEVPADIYLGSVSVNSYSGLTAVGCRVAEVLGHVWHKRKYPLSQLRSATASTPIYPFAGDGKGMVESNRAIATCAEGTLYVSGVPDSELRERVDSLVSSASDALGKRTFQEVFETDAKGNIGRMFGEIPFAFALAKVTLISVDTGKSATAGATNPDVLAEVWNIAG